MVTLEEIAGRLKNKGDYDFAANKRNWEPQRAEDYVLPAFVMKESMAKGAEAKLRKKLSKVLAFIDLVKHKRLKSGCTIMPISVNNKDLLAIWNNKMGVSRALECMAEIGLLSIESDRYQFGAYHEKDNASRTYRYYKENEDNVCEYCKAHNIEMFIIKNEVYATPYDVVPECGTLG